MDARDEAATVATEYRATVTYEPDHPADNVPWRYVVTHIASGAQVASGWASSRDAGCERAREAVALIRRNQEQSREGAEFEL